MDSDQSVITTIYNRLITDEVLKVRVGGNIRLYLVMAIEDAVFPYMVHKLDLTVQDAIVPATYRMDIWDFSHTAGRIYGIRSRVVELLDGEVFPLAPDGDVQHVRMKLESGGLVGTDAPDVWRYELLFSCRFSRSGELARILDPA